MGEGEKLLGEAREPLDLVEAGAERVFVLDALARTPKRHFELRAEAGERRAQLVRGVRGEAPLSFEGLLDAPEHLVERLHEPSDLVAPARMGKRSEERRVGKE